MDKVLSASVQDCVRRLRLAGDLYHDLRCLIFHDVKLPWEFVEETYGEIFFYGFFTPQRSKRNDRWHIAFYLVDERQQLRRARTRGPWSNAQRSKPQNAPNKDHIQNRMRSLFSDAFWLADTIGLKVIPGTSNIDHSSLSDSHSTWMWLVFHAAWVTPRGTILRAHKLYPAGMLAKYELRKKQEAEVGYDENKGSFDDYMNAKEAIQKRQLEMSREAREKEFNEILRRVESEANAKLESGALISILPVDPFTLSASLLELMAAGGAESGENPPAREEPPEQMERRSRPMPKAEMARRIMDKRTARARDVEAFLKRHGLQKGLGNKWTVCLDGMDQDTIIKLEKP